MKYKLKNVLIALLSLILVQCSSNESLIDIEIYKWETSELMFTTYFYKVQNNNRKDLIVEFVVEATCEDGTVYSDEGRVKVSSGKKRKSSAFFSTGGKQVEKIEVVDIKARLNPF